MFRHIDRNCHIVGNRYIGSYINNSSQPANRQLFCSIKNGANVRMSLAAFSKKRFLIADPLESYCFTTKKMLIDLGLKLVNTAGSAPVVLSGVQNMDYDVILCNFELGDGKNGQELLEELRVRKLLKFSCLFFIVTAEVAKDKVLGTIENEPDGYLVKPLTPADLEKRLQAALLQKEAFSSLNSAIDRGEYEKAITICNAKLAENNRHTMVLLKTKAWLLTKAGQQTAAKALYQDLLAKSDQQWARLGLAEILTEEYQFDAAEQQLNHIIEEDSQRVEAYDLLARVKNLQHQPDKAQKLLEKATAQSPNSVKRQKALADIRLTNGDQTGAIESLRKVVKLGNQSIYAEPDHYFTFANLLAKASEGSARSKFGKEALEVLSKSRKKFSEREQFEFQSTLIEAQVHAELGEPAIAEALLQQVQDKAALRKEPLNAESSVIAAQTLIKLGREHEVDEFIQKSADKAAKYGIEVGAIYRWLDSRIDLKQRQKATELNKNGIYLHGQGDLDGAIKSMLLAIPYTPHHISLNLNLFQLLLKKLKADGMAKSFRKKAEECLHRVRHIPKHHKEYRRYCHLKKQFDDLC